MDRCIRLAWVVAALALAGPGFALDRFPLQVLGHPDPQAGDMFGDSLAVAGDHLLVGAPKRDDGPTQDVGAVFSFDLASFAFVRRIDPGAGWEDFGESIVSCGGGNFVATSYRSKRAAIFSATTGLRLTDLLDPDTQSGGYGAAVASDGVIIAVSDLFEPTAGGTGAIHIYDALTGGFLRTVHHPNPLQFGLGNSLLIDGETLFAGSIYSTTETPPGAAGEAYAFSTIDGSLLGTYPDITNGQNLLGASLAILGDRLVVGPGYDDGFPYGVMYIYERASPVPVMILRSPGLEDSGLNDNFGRELATGTDGSLFVGAPRGPHQDATRPGVVYTFEPETGEMIGRLLAADGSPGFLGAGSALEVSDGTIYVGAPGYSSAASPEGRVFIYYAVASSARNWDAYP